MDYLNSFLLELNQNGYDPVRPLKVDGNEWGRLKYNDESASKASGGYKLIQNPDGSLFANYGSTKDRGGFRSWKSDRVRELSYEEMVSERTARNNHRKYVEDQQRLRHEKIGRRLAKAIAAYPVAVEHAYLADKGVDGHGIRIRPKTGELLIPRYGIDGRIYSIQHIIQKKPGQKSWKGYFKGALGKDLYYPLMAETDDKGVIVLCEGFATGASIRDATGLPVVVCFDAGALAGVTRGMRGRYANARIVIAADNDQWVFAPGKKARDLDTAEIAGDDPRWSAWRDEGVLFNPGIEKARAAAAGAGGAHVLIPDFEATHPKKMTDFNDLAREKGADHVKMMFDKILEIPSLKPTEEAGGGGFGNPVLRVSDVQPPPAGDNSKNAECLNELGFAFKILGYNNGVYYYYPHAMRQIVAFTASSHSMQNLIQLDSLERWETPWRDNQGKLSAKHQQIALCAADNLMRICQKRGVFTEESRVRGAGAWIDEGRVILHCGDSLYVDGNYERFERLESAFTYVASIRLMRPASAPLGNTEARQLRTICESVTWENRLSGTLLAGWLVIAPVCAALQYRPHIYITGEAESGKSTVMDKIVKPVLGKMGLFVDGGTTEPAIRDLMGYDARPLIYDEAEPSPSMSDVILLARKASTGAVVKKHGQKPFKARFCACFSAINPPVNKTADESRISFMHLKKNRRPTAMQEYDDLLEKIDEVISDDFSERLIARTLQNMNSLIANIRIFQRAVRKSTGAARASQQIGAMLAGVYMLGRTDIISEESAADIVSRFNYTDHTIIEEAGDPARLLQWVAASTVRMRSGSEMSIGELINTARIERDVLADKLLRSYGIIAENDRVIIASTGQNLAKLLKDTDWHAKWSRTLSDIIGAEKLKSVYFSPGFKTSAVAVPMSYFSDPDAAPAVQEEIPFDGWEAGRE